MKDNGQFLSKWLRSEVAVAFAIGSVVAGTITYFTAPVNKLETQQAVMQSQMDNIKNNDLTHIYQEQTIAAAKLDSLEKESVDQGKTLIQILTIVQQSKK